MKKSSGNELNWLLLSIKTCNELNPFRVGKGPEMLFHCSSKRSSWVKDERFEGSVPRRFWWPIWIRVTLLESEQTTWVHLQGSRSDHPRVGGGFRPFFRESMTEASVGAGWESADGKIKENPTRKMAKSSNPRWVFILRVREDDKDRFFRRRSGKKMSTLVQRSIAERER